MTHAKVVGRQRHRSAIGLPNIRGESSEQIFEKSSATAQALSRVSAVINPSSLAVT